MYEGDSSTFIAALSKLAPDLDLDGVDPDTAAAISYIADLILTSGRVAHILESVAKALTKK